MTREEAATVFKAFMDNPLFSDVHKQAFNIAIHDIKQRHDWDINKLMLVPKTEWEQESTTKNNLVVDCIKKSDAIDIIQDMHGLARADVISDAVNRIIAMPSVTPQEPVIDKIRAEIETIIGEHNLDDYDFCSGLIVARKIIDKYKGESA